MGIALSKKRYWVVCVFFILFFAIHHTQAAETQIFGPNQYDRTQGDPDIFTGSFSAMAGEGTLTVKNGQVDGNSRIVDTISSARITVNGNEIFGPNDFNKNVYLLESSISLSENNSIIIEFASQPGSFLTVEITQEIPNPTVSISTTPAEIQLGESSTLTWISIDTDSCTIEPDIGGVDPSGSLVVSPNETTTYTITAAGLGGTATDTVTVTVYQPPTVNIAVDPGTILLGESSTLSWTSTDADTAAIDQGIGSVAVTGSISLSPIETTTYSITVNGSGGSATENVTLTITHPVPVVSISANPSEIQLGESSTLNWSSTNADSCVIEPGIGTVDPSGSFTVSPTETTNYIITAIGAGYTVVANTTIMVVDPNGPPTVSFDAQPSSIQKGEPSVLSWDSINAESAYIDNGIGVVATSGSTVVSPEYTTTYSITVTGTTGSSNARVTVNVLGTPEPQPEGSFGQHYEDLIPPNATVEAYDPDRFALITGLVHTIDDTPINDVTVAIHDHPEYGSALTDADGRFSIPAEGGGTLTIRFQKQSLLTVQRQIYVPWNDIAIAETIQMISEDPISTIVTFDGNPDTIITHKSSDVTNEFGNRSATIVFKGDNHAYLVDENGADLKELATFTARATEYSTPESMPSVLPPTSAFTYCTELTVDGAQSVRFEKPVVVWVNNFLGFNVGEIVPVGYYNWDKAVWIPSENGRIVALLDMDSDGIVDSLDVDGDGQPDDLNANGFFNDEVTGLEDSSIYIPGDTYTRFTVTHFSPHDPNFPRKGPEDAIYSNAEGKATVDQQASEDKPCGSPNGSFVKERSRNFHENIDIPGTDLTLYYSSSRVKGSEIKISVPVSGDTVPPSLIRIIVRVDVAGKRFERILDPLPNQVEEFSWDGLDYMGRPSPPVTANVSIGFEYPAYYTSIPADILWQAFGMVGDETTTIRAIQNIVYWSKNDLQISPETNIKGTLAEGWTLSYHHALKSPDAMTLHKGDGTLVKDKIGIIKTAAGTSGIDILIDSAGNLFMIDGCFKILKVDKNGIFTTIVGNGASGYGGDGGPATDAQINFPTGISMDDHGNLYIVDQLNFRIRKVDTNGIITTVAGNGMPGFPGSGDGELATDVALSLPGEDIVVDKAGNFYFVDGFFNILRKVDTNGIITTVAGHPFEMDYSGDGGPATKAKFNLIKDLAADAGGNIYVADSYNHRVRKIDTSGTVTTIAGNGIAQFSGDGGAATEASLSNPQELAIDTKGNIFISDTGNCRIRKVDTKGIITTVAGNGTCGLCEVGTPPTKSNIYPGSISLDANGDLYFAGSEKILKVDASGLQNGADGLFTEKTGLGYIMSTTGVHQKTVDLDTGITLRDFNYNENNKLVSIVDQFGNETIIQRDGNSVPAAIVSPDGLITNLTIDSNNHLTHISYPDGSDYEFEYTSDGLLTTKIEPEYNRFVHQFDIAGKLTVVSDEEGGQWHYENTALENGDILTKVTTGEGNLTSYLDHTFSTGAYTSRITGPTGAVTLYSQASDGLTVNKSLPCGMDLEFKYDVDPKYKFKYIKESTELAPSGLGKIILRKKTYEDTNSDAITDLITETITVNGKATKNQNNVLQSQRTIISPEGRAVTTYYDPTTLATENVSVPGFFDTHYTYDTKGRVTDINTNTRHTSLTYNAQGFLESITDSENHATTYDYDPVGRVTAIHRPDTSDLYFDYDANGNKTVLTNPFSINHGFGYNKVNLQDKYQTPISGNYGYVYNKEKALIQTNYPSGKQINNIYDKTRLMQIQTPEANIDFTYLCGTKVVSISKGTESITYGYDGKLVTSETLSGTFNSILTYTYNNDFDVIAFSYAGDSEAYAYDNDGLLTGSGDYAISRNGQNGLPEAINGGALSVSRSFNGFGELDYQGITVNGLNLHQWNLVRDNNGRITQKTEIVNGTTSVYDYTYDTLGRLLTVTKDSELVEQYQYDLSGAREYEVNSLRGRTDRSMSYSDEDHLLTAGNVTYNYDSDGFLTTRIDGADITRYSYSLRGELLNVRLPNGTFIEYIHDPLGRRIAKKINGTVTEKYLWQELTQLLAVYDGSDNLIMRFEYADNRMPVAMTKNGPKYYLTYDQVGSLRSVADAMGNVVKEIEYDSFGNIINDSNPIFNIPFGFAGGLNDADTGLVRFGYRDYDPDIGRWTAKDPIFFAGGDTDLYGYCLNDPINSVDLEGLLAFNLITGGVGAAIGAGISTAHAWASGVRGWDLAKSAAIGAAGGAVSGFVLSPMGVMVAGIGSSMLSDIASQTFIEGKNLCDIDPISVAISGVSGLIGGGFADDILRAIGAASLIDELYAVAASGMLSGFLNIVLRPFEAFDRATNTSSP